MEKIIRRFKTHEEADAADREYWRRMTPDERTRMLLEMLYPEDSRDESAQRLRELLELFESNGVGYAVVGAFDLAHHAKPRCTGDLDLWVRPAPSNAANTVRALKAFGFASLALGEIDFLGPDQVVQLGHAPVREDLLTGLTGVSNDKIIAGRVRGSLGGVDVWYLGKAELRKNKAALGRLQDLADLELLN